VVLQSAICDRLPAAGCVPATNALLAHLHASSLLVQANKFKSLALDLLEEARKEAEEANRSKSAFL
jgi:hypothetical protein